jgi:hypothetical protein
METLGKLRRRHLVAYSTQNGQGFHAKLDSQSTAKWTVSRSAATRGLGS